jgi:Tol biopolymer transport system component
MSLTPGTRLGPYEITSAIGAGGMGEVYRAFDSNLKRSVAIKVLPASVAGDADRLTRFQREAEVLGALNHPNIAAIYGLEKTPALTALVLELVDGDDLSHRISRGAIPLDEAIPIAKQIAEALEAAHEQGIIHRDLKPANIKVRPDGAVKVLDFGLAKALGSEGLRATVDLMNSPTVTARATQAGVILGTAAYMAPEQARGRVVDKRADIWAFGVVVFEMLTGTRAFGGDDMTDTIASVVSKEPDWNALPAATPVGLRRLLVRCLKKDPKARLRDIGDARLQIEELISGATDEMVAGASSRAAVRGPTPQPSAVSRALPWAVASALAVALIVSLWGLWRAASAPPRSVLPLTPLSFEQGGQTAAVWSPDGKAVAYGARQKDTDPYQVYVRDLDSAVARKITDVPGVRSIVQWTTAGKIVFVAGGQLWSVSPVPSDPERWPPSTTGRFRERMAQSVSRDGAAVAVFVRGDDFMTSVWTGVTGDQLKPYAPAPFASRSVIPGPPPPVIEFSPDGRQILLLGNAGAGEEAWLMPYPASAANPPHRVLPGVSAFSGTPTASWMPDNRHVVLSATEGLGPRQLYLADTVSGELTVISSGTTAQDSPAVSPDGSKLVFLETTSDRDIVSVDLATASVTPVIATQRSEQMPAWASKELAMVYVTDRSGGPEIWLHRPGQQPRPLVTGRHFPEKTRGFAAPALSPDGKRVIYMRIGFTTELGVLWMSAVDGGPPVRLVKRAGAVFEWPGSWSPDGNWYVYRAVQNRQESLNKVKTTGEAEPEVLNAANKNPWPWVPLWSPADDWILYGDDRVKLISTDGKMMHPVSGNALAYAFSRDGLRLYGLRQPDASGRVELFWMSVPRGDPKRIGFLTRDDVPAATSFSLNLSLTQDGKSVMYGTLKTTSNLWLMDGLTSVTVR